MTLKLPKNRPPLHPGEILIEEYMIPYDLAVADYFRFNTLVPWFQPQPPGLTQSPN